jgi:hypothetical protein
VIGINKNIFNQRFFVVVYSHRQRAMTRNVYAALAEAARCKARVEINGKTIWSATDGE